MLDHLDAEEEPALAQASRVGEKILARLGEPYLLSGQARQSTPSIGITLFDGDSREGDLLRQADQAMYQAKSAGRNRLQFYTAR
jgi:GGDEF domain-containing protein